MSPPGVPSSVGLGAPVRANPYASPRAATPHSEGGIALVLGGLVFMGIGVASFLNAEAHGGLIWVGGFFVGGSMLLRGLFGRG